VLPHVTTTADEVDGTLARLDPLVAKLNPTAPQLEDTLRALRPTVTDANTLLRDATPLLRTLHPTVSSLATTANVGVPVIRTLAPSLQRADQKILPGLAMTSPEDGKETVYEAIGPVLTAFASLSAGYDRDGDFANLTLGLGNQNAQNVLPCSTNFANGSTDFLVCESLSTALSTVFGAGTSLLGNLLPHGQAAGALASILNHGTSVHAFNAATAALSKRASAAARYLNKRGS
jgi:hypothetical protein